LTTLDRGQIYSRFNDVVNMAPAELDRWLETEPSHKVGFRRNGVGESVGHASGRRIVAILHKGKGDLDDDDYAHMRKVFGYVRRHLAQQPQNMVTSRWRYSLMNWGHDPIKE